MATEKKAVTVYVDGEIYARVQAAALEEGRSVSNLIERTLVHAFPMTGKRMAAIFGEPVEGRDFHEVKGGGKLKPVAKHK
jgi:hypothetical protein